MLSLREEQLWFQSCDLKKTEVVIDHSGKLISYLKDHPLPSTYAELYGGQYSQVEPWRVFEVDYLGGGPGSCGFELPGVAIRGAGEKPLWMVDLTEERIIVHEIANLKRLGFVRQPVQQGGSQSLWQGEITHPAEHKVSVKVENRLCLDKELNIHYPYRVQMVLNGNSFFGCGRQGNIAARVLPGLYQAKEGGILLNLNLSESGAAQLITRQSSQVDIVQIGQWRLLNNSSVMLQFESQDGQKIADLLLLKRIVNGNLRQKGYHNRYGQDQLRFIRLGPEPHFWLENEVPEPFRSE